jgi:excisionase family DNA binding protein
VNVTEVSPGDMLTVTEAGAFLGCSESTVRRLLRKGELIWLRHGHTGRVVIPGTAVEQFLHLQLLDAVAEAGSLTGVVS